MTVQKAVVMAGGLGTRMRPYLASPINKHLTPVGDRPLIDWPLQLIRNTGITKALVMLNGTHAELLMETIGTGAKYQLDVFYRYIPETHGASVGKHLKLAQPWVGEDEFLLILGDSVYLIDSLPDISNASAPHAWTMRVGEILDPDPSKYAFVPDKEDEVQTGAWLFDSSIFTVLEELEHRQVPEIRIRTIIEYLSTINTTILPPHSFIDCGTPDAIKFVEKRLG